MYLPFHFPVTLPYYKLQDNEFYHVIAVVLKDFLFSLLYTLYLIHTLYCNINLGLMRMVWISVKLLLNTGYMSELVVYWLDPFRYYPGIA